MKKLLVLLLISVIITNLNAQSIGDTVIVQGFTYSSNTRDSIINFPTNPAVSYERVVMRYAMRCKNALVSTGSQRNLGCGEWDYSCNTYIHNPNAADSVKSSTAKYQITPNTNPTSIYSTIPTWSVYPSIQTKVVLNGITQEDTASVGSLITTADSTFINSVANGKSYVIYTASELLSAGLVAGGIDAIALHSNSNNVTINKLRVKLKHTSLTNLDAVDTAIFNSTQEVYYHDYTFSNGNNRIQFNNAFTWDGTSNIIVEFSYEGKSSNSALGILSSTSINSLRSSNDYSADLFPSNYIEANSYLGISTNNARTVEAWIKTTSSGEITTWGTNSTGQKQSFWVNGSGQLRLEINGAYAIGTNTVNDGQWHHVAFTFVGYNMYDVRFYIDGKWDFNSSVNTKNMNTQLSKKFQISKGFHNRYFDGEIDDIRVWSVALTRPTIQAWMHKKLYASHSNPANVHPNIANLELAYQLNEHDPNISDLSVNQHDAVFYSVPSFIKQVGDDMIKNFESVTMRPNIDFYQGTYNITVSADTVADTTLNDPYYVTERTIYPRVGTTSSDSIGSTLTTYYPQYNTVYDINGTVISNVSSSSTTNLQATTLEYYVRNPSKLEIMSFVTPYGIGLDLGVDGVAWYFDVTDFLPVLEGSRRISLERGGQNQEEMDIQFLFIIGTPPAEVKDIQQIWRVDQRNYSDINSNKYYAPRSVKLDTSARRYKLRSAITGHGQQGEFIGRNHSITINNSTTYNRFVWKECAENPVYPQGGTWIYDRAGWCPGMATDVEEYDITSLITSDSVTVDYNVQGATGDSRYIVNNQLVTYGAANFQNDARIIDVVRPTNLTEFGKTNPSCFNPIVTIQNTGANVLTSATIQISINGGSSITHNWSGNLGFMDEENIQIGIPQSFWATAGVGMNSFTATITAVNGGADQYIHNNSYTSRFEMPSDLPSNVNIVLKTNLAANQTSYILRNSAGAVVHQRAALSNNQTYSDNLTLPADCYYLRLFDSGDDGLSFWANSSGSGYFRITDQSGMSLTNFNPDCGDGIEYYFTVGRTTGIESQESENRIEVYPNPSEGVLFIDYENISGDYVLSNSVGQELMHGSLGASNNLVKLDVSSVAPGLYLLKVNSNNKTIIKKVIIN